MISLLTSKLYLSFLCEVRVFILMLYRFVQLVRKHKPNCLLHFEDFGVTNAQRLLNVYRDQHAVFNDDVYA